jgi:hypothetical protein
MMPQLKLEIFISYKQLEGEQYGCSHRSVVEAQEWIVKVGIEGAR